MIWNSWYVLGHSGAVGVTDTDWPAFHGKRYIQVDMVTWTIIVEKKKCLNRFVPQYHLCVMEFEGSCPIKSDELSVRKH